MSIMQRLAGGTAQAVEPHDFQLLVTSQGETTILAGKGEVDIATVPPLRAALTDAAEAERPNFIVDLTDVTFIDSVGVGAILHAKRRAGAEGRMAVVVPEASYARVIFEVVGADQVLSVFTTREDALASI
jgi:anti-anti-sigma factor